jgi:catechol 2,3-dioxygenase-like lactoylglutathione lyase family enzyme
MAQLDHVTVTASDFAASLAFYDAALGALGLERVAEHVDEEEDGAAVEAAGWAGDGREPVLWLVAGPVPTRGAHVRLAANSRAEVEAFHRAGVRAGGTEHAGPRRWVLYRAGEFNAIVADPDGNLIEAVAAEWPAAGQRSAKCSTRGGAAK